MTVWHASFPLLLLWGVNTLDRAIHFAWAAIFMLLALQSLRLFMPANTTVLSLLSPARSSRIHALLMAAVVLYLGSWLPDLDWKFGVHRSVFTHSLLPALLLGSVYSAKIPFCNRALHNRLTAVFCIGLASHLFVDYFQGGNLVAVPARYEMAFYFSNAVVLFLAGVLGLKLQSSKLQRTAAGLQNDFLPRN